MMRSVIRMQDWGEIRGQFKRKRKDWVRRSRSVVIGNNKLGKALMAVMNCEGEALRSTANY